MSDSETVLTGLSFDTPSWGSYPSIHNLGSRAIASLLLHPCYVEEKVDGSQFSFGVVNVEGENGPRLRIKSKNVEMFPEIPEKMFNLAAATARELTPLLTVGWTYRGEFLASPAHNSLSYERVPKRNIILFDVSIGGGVFLSRAELEAEAARLDLEVVPLLYSRTPTEDELRHTLDNQLSILGGQKIEGVVIKQQQPLLWGTDKKLLVGKFVSERFREIHKVKWGENQPNQPSQIAKIAQEVCTVARWHKMVQRLRDEGQLESSPRDIPKLLKAVNEDILKEESDHIKERLFSMFWRDISKLTTRGLPEWWKGELLKEQFNTDSVLSTEEID